MIRTDTEESPPRLLELPDTPATQRSALERLRRAAPPPRSPARHEAAFERAVADAAGRPRHRPIVRVATFAAACLAGVVITSAVHRSLPALATGTPVAALRPEIVAAPGAVWHANGRTVALSKGWLSVEPRGPVVVRCPNLDVVIAAARAAVDVADGRVTVQVHAGEVVLRTPGKPDERVTAPATRTVEPAAAPVEPLQLMPAGAGAASCPPGDEPCLSRVAGGTGLKAETALYELALVAHERGEHALAVERFRQHQQRFGGGVLSPEASIGVMLGLAALGDRPSAAAEAQRFLARFPEDPRGDRVRQLFIGGD